MNIRSWPFWILVIAVASGPWFGVVSHPQWERVTWIPFHGAEDKPKDVLVNFLLFVPFGWSFAKSSAFVKAAADRRSALFTLGTTIATAAIVSLAVETPQLFYRLRDPSATDVVMAMCGAGAGSLASQAFHRRDPRGAESGREAREGGRG
jgi:glycopeptide antibiotics resistance protein